MMDTFTGTIQKERSRKAACTGIIPILLMLAIALLPWYVAHSGVYPGDSFTLLYIPAAALSAFLLFRRREAHGRKSAGRFAVLALSLTALSLPAALLMFIQAAGEIYLGGFSPNDYLTLTMPIYLMAAAGVAWTVYALLAGGGTAGFHILFATLISALYRLQYLICCTDFSLCDSRFIQASTEIYLTELLMLLALGGVCALGWSILRRRAVL